MGPSVEASIHSTETSTRASINFTDMITEISSYSCSPSNCRLQPFSYTHYLDIRNRNKRPHL